MRAIPRDLRYVIRTVISTSLILPTASTALAAVSFTSTPTASLQANSPLSAELSFNTDVPAKVSYRVRSTVPGETWLIESSSFNTSHSLPILGLAANTSYVVDQIVVEEAGGMTDLYTTPLPLNTAPLPADFPTLSVNRTTPNQVEPGYTFIPSRANSSPTASNYSMALDAKGDVRWYIPGNAGDMHLSNGSLLGRISGSVVEMDFLGNIQQSFHSQQTGTPNPGSKFVDTFNFHHDIQRLPSGNFITFSRQNVVLNDVPTDELTQSDPNTHGTVTYRDEPVVEFDPNGTIVKQWNMVDIMDTSRMGYGTFLGNGIADWVHNNAVVYDPSDNSLTISARTQDAVFKIDYDTGDLIWILADHANWSAPFQQYLLNPVVGPGEEFVWPYHQHAPMYLDNGNLMLFDNHNFGASPTDPIVPNSDIRSRVLEYDIDPNTMTITQVWEQGTDDPDYIYANATGDADWMPITDNVLVSYGRTWGSAGVAFPASHPHIIEYNRAGERLFEVTVGAFGDNSTSYRTEKFPTLYDSSEFSVTFIPEPSTFVLLSAVSATLLYSRFRRKL